jgi:hypothetical protein
MKAKSGQIVLYLVLVLVAITFLAVMNVSAYLGVSAKNKTMNAGDAAALAVAKYQGELLNKIGSLNIEHLKAAIENDEEKCNSIMKEVRETCFLAPLEGIRLGNEAAKANGIEIDDRMGQILKQHANDIRVHYAVTPELYPPLWEGAWEEYALRLELAIASGVYAGPDNIDFVDAAGGHLLMVEQFYNAIAGRNWCWFHFNAPGILGTYSSYQSWDPLPFADPEKRRQRCANSEVYSLNLNPRTGSAVDLLGTNLIMRLTGSTIEELQNSYIITNQSQVWYFYGDMWRKWWEMDPDGEWQFPVVGPPKKEFDVRGAAAVCRVTKLIPDVISDSKGQKSVWSAAAKPFGTVENLDGETDVVTALRNFVVPSFTDAKLVPLDAVGGKDLSTADPDWMLHVREHLPKYLDDGPGTLPSCYYCSQLKLWERDYFRQSGRRWLKYNSDTCIRSHGPGPAHGGTPHGH